MPTTTQRATTRHNLDFASPLTEADQAAIREAIEERAAIREFDGGESREIAESQARRAMRVYRYRLTDKAGVWLTLIAPGCDLEATRHVLELRFGTRLLELREHREGGG